MADEDLNQQDPSGLMDKARRLLICHPLYSRLTSVDAVRTLMESHVFAVWDFMSLLKSLQGSLSCLEVPWTPTQHPKFRRFVNEIVCAEESDEDGIGEYKSHFEMYVEAMEDAGAETTPIKRFVGLIAGGRTVDEALRLAQAPDEARAFVSETFDVIEGGKTHEIAAAFCLGREEIIPAMFVAMVRDLSGRVSDLSRFHRYLRRHIDVDGHQHGPMAQQMLAELCGGDVAKLSDTAAVGVRVLRARVRLWDGVVTRIERRFSQGSPADTRETAS